MNTRIQLWTLLLIMSSSMIFAQIDRNRSLSQFRLPNQHGAAQFEALNDDVEFDGFNVRVGGGFTVQYQALSHESGGLNYDTIPLVAIENNFNLPTANLDLDVALAKGVRMHMRTYLSSRHHPESWVKGGYIQISSLDFINEGFLDGVMDLVTVKIGLMELNYGDYHFRRTDNARAIYNPFVGNLILDGFTTEMGAEIYVTPGDFILMAGITNGNLNQSVIAADRTPSILGKVAWDKQLSDDLRTRLSASIYTSADGQTNYLYFSDRAGSRYYMVMEPEMFISRSGQLTSANPTDQATSGRFNPSFINSVTAIMINPYLRWKGLEFFGTFETSSGQISAEPESRSWTQIHGELLYYFGENQNVFVGGKYNNVSGALPNFNPNGSGTEVSIDRTAFAAGWYMTPNVLLKAEYVMQNYNDFPGNGMGSPTQRVLNDGKFNGVVVEATVNF